MLGPQGQLPCGLSATGLHCCPCSPTRPISPLVPQARAEAARVAAALQAELGLLNRQLLPQLLPALQAYTRAAVAAGSPGSAAAEGDWQAAEAAVCGDALQLFVTTGCLAGAAGVAGAPSADALSGWLGGPLGASGQHGQAAAWQLLSQIVATTLREADRAFLLAAVDRANAGMDATGEAGSLGSSTAVAARHSNHAPVSGHCADCPPPSCPDGLQAWMRWVRCWRSACLASRPLAWRLPRSPPSCSIPSSLAP